MKITRAMPIGALSVCSALALLVTGCSSDGGSGSADSADSAAATSPSTTEATTTTTAGPPVDPVTGAGAPEVVADGFGFLEGVTWNADDGTLLFTDKEGQLLELGADDEVTVVDPDTDIADIDGDGAGGLIATEPDVGTAVQVTADGTREVLADGLDGVAFSGPNGVAAASDGTVWFTDFAPGAETPLGYRGVFRVSPEGAVTAEVEMDPEATAPNGIALSPDQQTLYVSDTLGNDVTAYAIAVGGGLEDVAAPLWVAEFEGFPDGVCVDATGNLYVIGAGAGVAAYAPDGTLWGTIALPDPEAQPTNCAVGGDDGRTLFVTTSTTLYRIALG